MTSLEYDWTCALSGLVYSEQGGQKLISDGGSLFIRKNLKKGFIPIISNFLLYETQKDGAPRDTWDPQFHPPGPDSEQNFSKKQQICSMYIPISNTLTNKFMMGYNLFES